MPDRPSSVRRREVLSASVLAVVFLLGLSALAGPALASPADTTYADNLLLYPPAPCVTDTVTVFVRGYIATPCDSFLSAERVGERQIRIRTQVYSDRLCFAAPFEFFSVPVVMGRFDGGPQEIQILRETIVRDGLGVRDTVRASSTLAFEVSNTCESPTVPADRLPFVFSVTTVPSPPCPNRPVSIHIAGVFNDGCGRVVSVDPATMSVVIAPYPPVITPCTLALKPWSADLPIGLLQAGHHRVVIRLTVAGTNAFWPPVPTQTYRGVFDFDVLTACGPPELLPYVSFVNVRPHRPCAVRPLIEPRESICPSDSIEVLIGGEFPSSCFSVQSLEAIDPGYGSPLPMPPIVRLTVSDQGCTRIACTQAPQPWSRAITLPPLPSRNYSLVVEEVRWLDCPPNADRHSALVPFRVAPADSCPSYPCACVMPVWEGAPGPETCVTFLAPGQSTSLGLGVHTPVPLAGLEGSLHVGTSGLRITALEAIGPAAGMHLTYTEALDGVRFVMFAPQGAPIPAAVTGPPIPILRVTVALRGDATEKRHTLWTGFDFLGSDAHGNGLPFCIPPWAMVVPPTAVICVEQGECDFNADATVDVRDLVMMVHCVMEPPLCPPDADSRFDCDGNGQLELSDVICCARAMLRGPACPACPADTVRAAPDVKLEFGSPVVARGEVVVPMRLMGSGGVGAAHLRMNFPTNRFVITGVEGPSDWILLHQENLGAEPAFGPSAGLSLGLIRATSDDILALAAPLLEAPLEVRLRLSLRPGMSVGGELWLVEAEFSGRDGVRLKAPPAASGITLAGGSGVALSPARPNPFSGETRFAVTLDLPGRLEVGIYDLAGRRVAKLFDGPATAGAHTLSWDGRDADGRRAPGGVYFYRAIANGKAVTRRMVMLEGR